MTWFTVSGPLVLLLLAGIWSVSGQTSMSLASFDSTRIPGLTAACNSVYSAPLSGCQPSDFVATNPCSSMCISSLQAVENQARTACANNPTPPNSMLGFSRDGQGVQQLCVRMKASGLGSQTLRTVATPGATQLPTTPQSTSTPKIEGGDSSMALSASATIGVVVTVVIAIVLLAMGVGTLYRKHYNAKE